MREEMAEVMVPLQISRLWKKNNPVYLALCCSVNIVADLCVVYASKTVQSRSLIFDVYLNNMQT
jgi:hypothetical protein